MLLRHDFDLADTSHNSAKLNRLYFLRWLCAFMGSTVLGCSFRTVVSSVMPYNYN